MHRARDIMLIIAAAGIIIAAMVFTLGGIYAIYLGYKLFAPWAWEPDQAEVMVFGECKKVREKYIVTVEVENFGQIDIQSLQCRILDKGDMRADADEQYLGALMPGSTDVCTFVLQGELIKPVKFEVVYDGKSTRDVCDVIDDE